MSARPYVAVLVLAALLSLWNLGGYDLGAPDEPYFGEGAREMVADGQWLVPHVNGVVTTDKPPLFFWLIALLSLPFGEVTSWTARLPSALAAIGSVALTMRLGTRLLGPRIGVLSGVVLCTTYLPWDKSRSAQIDALLCLLILTALSAFEAHRSGSAHGRRAGLLFWTAAALAGLAKGPVGLLIPLGVAVVTLVFDRDLGSWRRFAPLSGPALFVLVAGAWMMTATYGSHGEYSAWAALEKHFFKRAVYGMSHPHPPWYYAKVLPVQLLPWTGIVAGGIVLAWRRRREPAFRLLLVWAAFVVLFFSISTEKRDLYVLPAYPAFAMLGAALVEAAAGAWSTRWVTVPQGAVGAILVAVGIVMPSWVRHAFPQLGGAALVLAVAMVLGGAAIVAAAIRGRSRPAAAVTAAAVTAIYLVTASSVLPAGAVLKSARPFALEVRKITAPARASGERVLAYCLSNLTDGLSLYSEGVYLPETCDPAVLAAHLERGPQAWAVVNGGALDALPAALRGRLEVAARADLSRMNVQLVHVRD